MTVKTAGNARPGGMALKQKKAERAGAKIFTIYCLPHFNLGGRGFGFS
jgi:hypothetical protein